MTGMLTGGFVSPHIDEFKVWFQSLVSKFGFKVWFCMHAIFDPSIIVVAQTVEENARGSFLRHL